MFLHLELIDKEMKQEKKRKLNLKNIVLNY
jgi:hypothetical protein